MNNQAKFSHVPYHVGLIPDGGRRWAKQHHISYLEAYQLVMQNVTDFVDKLFNYGSFCLSIYLLSKENLTRPDHELLPVLEAEQQLLEQLLPPVLTQLAVKMVHVGRKEYLPPSFAQAITKLEQHTASFQQRKLYLLLGYDPHDELSQAYETWDRKTPVLPHLWVQEPLDLVIRTSGENRLSNFLPLQSGYAEYIFIDKHSTELSTTEINNCLQEYGKRQRRFGK